MQRRAVAVYVAIFLLVGVGSYALITTAQAPTVSIDDAEYQLSDGDTFEINGTTYTASELSGEEEDGETVYSGTIEWSDPEAELSEQWSNESTIEYDDAEWEVAVDSGDEPDGFTLVEQLDRQAILEEDPDVGNETVEDEDGNESVIVVEDGQEVLVPADEYFPEPRSETFSSGDTLTYNNETVTVDTVDPNFVIVTWTGEETYSEDLEQEQEVTLENDQTFLVFFESDSSVGLIEDRSSYEAQVAQVDRFNDRISGLWYILVTSFSIVGLLLMLAFLPSRY
ncbi:hypothetical protein [Halalkalirubrum salinum]|uniref:hypothetical protein n=1 Tax=Halalkalirubrum salinum TaxID=2563889 RepID=UPI0010FB7E64|nr:hypothetical protein [Halalkalirubrum salinum]